MTILISKPGSSGGGGAGGTTENLVPYVGATSDLDLGSQDLIMANLSSGVVIGTSAELASIGTGTGAQFLQGDLTWAIPSTGSGAGLTTGVISVVSPLSTDNLAYALESSIEISIDTANLWAVHTTGVVTVVSPLSTDNLVQVLGNSLEIGIDTSGFFPTITTGDFTATAPLALDNTRQVLGGAVVASMPTSYASGDGYLTQADWTTFNGKWAVQTTGALTGTSPVTITGAREVFGGATTVSIDTSTFASAQTSSRSLIIADPSATADYSVWRVPQKITIDAVHILLTGAAGDTAVGFIDVADAQGQNAAATSGDAIATAGTNLTTASFTANANTALAGQYIQWHTTAGTGNGICVTMDYSV